MSYASFFSLASPHCAFFGGIALALELLHAVRPAWWLNTLIDVLAVVVAHTEYRTH